MSDFPIVDPHQHFWDLSLRRHHWLIEPVRERLFGDYSGIQRDYLLDDYLADAAKLDVVKTVHVEAEFDETAPVEETKWLQAHADRHGFPHGIVGNADLAAPDVGEVLDKHMEFPNFRGIRHTLCYDPDPTKSFSKDPGLIKSPEFLRGFSELARRNLSFDLAIFYRQADDAVALARRFPDTQFILGHAGMPFDRTPAALSGWKDGMSRLAEAPNVATKISGFGVSDPNWTVDSIRPLVDHLIGCFGTDRCMFASNFPVDKLFKTLDEVYGAFIEIVADRSIDERRRMFHDNAVRIYRL